MKRFRLAAQPGCFRKQCTAILLLLLATITSCHQPAPPPLPFSFWVWNRDDSLSPVEQQDIETAGVHRLFWHVGELELRGTALVWKEQHRLPADTPRLHLVPVIRISPAAVSPSQWAASLAGQLEPFTECQLDFDCKTGRLAEYAQALHLIRRTRPGLKLSITALAHWAGAPHWQDLMREVDEVFPMFYDLEPDAPLKPGTLPRPLIDLPAVDQWAPKWQHCPVPWHLGLPNVTRLTTFNASGGKHLRSWTSETLRALGPPSHQDGPALTLWQPSSSSTALRRPAASDIQAALSAGQQAGAAGVIWFSLPQPGRAASGWSVPHLRHIATGDTLAPSFALTFESVEGGHRLHLQNTAGTDAVDDTGACFLRLQFKPGSLREALPGGFESLSLLSTGRPTSQPREADEARLLFSRLDAGGSLTSSLVRFIPGFEPSASLSWSVESGMIKGLSHFNKPPP